MRLPPQSAPVHRDLLTNQDYLKGAGVEAAQSECDSLHGMARQMCYAIEYGYST